MVYTHKVKYGLWYLHSSTHVIIVYAEMHFIRNMKQQYTYVTYDLFPQKAENAITT